MIMTRITQSGRRCQVGIGMQSTQRERRGQEGAGDTQGAGDLEEVLEEEEINHSGVVVFQGADDPPQIHKMCYTVGTT